jgi:GNAT superfamily N-acetyltransferase
VSRAPLVRPATPADAPAIAALFTASRRAAMPWLREVHGPGATAAWFRAAVLPRREVLVAADPAGALLAFIAFGGGEVEHLYVAPGARGRGLGSRLLGLAQARATSLELWVFQRNAAARAFYERRGFRLVGTTDGAGNEEREPDARYRWEAGAAAPAAGGRRRPLTRPPAAPPRRARAPGRRSSAG